MNLSTSTPAVTGAARGLGRHLVDELLERGAPKVYALARETSRVRQDPRIVPVAFDLLDPVSIAAAARRAADITLLINNASTAEFAGPLEAAPDGIDREMAVNYHGTYAAIRAFVPVLEANGGRQIVNVLSLLSLASAPPMAGYAASKAAAHSLTQALRPVLAERGVGVHGVYPAGIDTDMVAGIDIGQDAARAGGGRAARRAGRRRGGHLPGSERPGDGADLVVRPEGVRARVLGRCCGVLSASGQPARTARGQSGRHSIATPTEGEIAMPHTTTTDARRRSAGAAEGTRSPRPPSSRRYCSRH